MARPQHTPSLAHLEEALSALFCLIDDAYANLNPKAGRYESIKRLSDSEVIALALFQQLRGVESERSFLRDAKRFFSHLFPGVAGPHPSSFDRRVRKLGRYLEPLRREILPELVGDPETLLVDSTLLEVLHPRQVPQSASWGNSSAGAAWVRWGTHRDRSLEPQEGLWVGPDFGHHAHWTGYQDRGQGLCAYTPTLFSGQQDF